MKIWIEDLCKLYGCDECPGALVIHDEITYCVHGCHPVPGLLGSAEQQMLLKARSRSHLPKAS